MTTTHEQVGSISPTAPLASAQPVAVKRGSIARILASCGRWLRAPERWVSLAIGVALIGLAEVSADNEWVSKLILPAPSDVWTALVDGFSNGIFWPHIWSTGFAAGFGFFLATLLALAIAGLLSAVPFLERVFMPYVVAFQSLPKIAVAPLVILWMGFGTSAKTVVVMIVCFFPILVNSLQGFQLRDREQIELFRSLGASRMQLLIHLRLPSALPFIFAGLHIGAVFALLGAVVAEFVGSDAGLGYILLLNKGRFNVPGVFAVLVILMVMGIAVHTVSRIIERRVVFWSKDMTDLQI